MHDYTERLNTVQSCTTVQRLRNAECCYPYSLLSARLLAPAFHISSWATSSATSPVAEQWVRDPVLHTDHGRPQFTYTWLQEHSPYSGVSSEPIGEPHENLQPARWNMTGARYDVPGHKHPLGQFGRTVARWNNSVHASAVPHIFVHGPSDPCHSQAYFTGRFHA